MKASDIKDEQILTLVYEKRKQPWYFSPDEPLKYPTRWVLRNELEEALPQFHYKVILAKLRSLNKRGLITGCFCGCRGDIELTEHGAFVAETYLVDTKDTP